MAYRNVVVAAADHSTNDSVRHGRALAESFGSNFVVVTTDRQPADFATDGFEIVTRQGDLSEVALDEANVRNARLIAIDAGFARRMHPTAAERVVRRASCSVLVTRPDFGLRVAVATDLSVPSVPAIVAGVQEAKRRDVPITVVHCVDTRAAIAQATSVIVPILAMLECEAELVILDTSPVETILHVLEGVGADLLVVAAHGQHHIACALLGRTTEVLVRAAPCSVLVVRA